VNQPPAHACVDSVTDGFATVTMASLPGALEATFAPGVGMVGCSLRHEGEELLGQRGGLSKYAQTGSSMGIPLLHPWANRLSGLGYEAAGQVVELDAASAPLRLDENGLPIHGVLTASPGWEVSGRGADDDSAWLHAHLDFGGDERYLAAFPFPHVLELQVRLAGSELTVATTLTPTGEVRVPVAFGWHPYFSVPGAPRQEWEIALPVRSHAALDERGIPTGESERAGDLDGPLGDRSFDDLFPKLGPEPRFAVEGGDRRIEVSFLEGYPVAQVYAPADQEFICFEPMTAPTNALVSGDGLRLVEPGESFAAAFAIKMTDKLARSAPNHQDAQ
jgi:galactose mutarotase-like enzyme